MKKEIIMPVMKSKDMDWKVYLSELAQSSTKMSSIEMQEFSGFLLKRDLLDPFTLTKAMRCILYNKNILSLVSEFMVNESEDTKFDLCNAIKEAIISFYDDDMQSAIEAKKSEISIKKHLEDDGA